MARAGLGLALLLTWSLGLAGEAMAVGPFTHLILSQKIAAQTPDLTTRPEIRRALRLGALAPDAGYYSDATPGLAETAHLVQPWEVCQALLDLAGDDTQRAFALGYLSHALIDRLAHQELVNSLAKGPYSRQPLDHKRVEWGLDCWLLARPENQWLWGVADAPGPDELQLWRQAMGRVHGVDIDPGYLATALAAQMREVRRLPRVFWFSGQTRRPGDWWGNALGWVLHDTLRPLTVALMRWQGGYLNEVAVLDARPARPADVTKLRRLLDQAASAARELLDGGGWPEGNLDADPACAAGDCPDLRAARSWLGRLGARE